MARAAATVPLARIAEALRRLPDQAKTWTRAAQREAWGEFKARREFPGLEARLHQPDARQSLRRGGRVQPGLRSYAYAARGPRKRGAFAYQASGAMAAELRARRLRIRVSAGAVVGRASLHARVLPLLAQMRGTVSQSRTTEAVSYMLTVYQNSKTKSGARRIPVTRLQTVTRSARSPRSYADEWAWKPAELVWLRRRVEQLQLARARRSAFDKKGNIRTRYASAFDGAAA